MRRLRARLCATRRTHGRPSTARAVTPNGTRVDGSVHARAANTESQTTESHTTDGTSHVGPSVGGKKYGEAGRKVSAPCARVLRNGAHVSGRGTADHPARDGTSLAAFSG